MPTLPPAYTKLLMAGTGGESAAPPDGFRWVVVDISGTLATLATAATAQILFYAGSPAFFCFELCAQMFRPFHWRGRQVIDPVDSPLSSTLLGAGTASYSVTGYELSIV